LSLGDVYFVFITTKLDKNHWNVAVTQGVFYYDVNQKNKRFFLFNNLKTMISGPTTPSVHNDPNGCVEKWKMSGHSVVFHKVKQRRTTETIHS
jgi:hypothetical protein